MTSRIFASVLALGALACAGSAQADAFYFSLDGAGVSISGTLTVGPDPNADTKDIFGTPANLVSGVDSGNPAFTYQGLVDPPNALDVTKVTGTVKLGVTNAKITGLIPTDPQAHHDADWTIPHSFGWYPGLPSGPVVSYDNLFYMGAGAPETCFGVPPGGYFDDYGVMFQLSNGDVIDMYSNGDAPTNAYYGIVVWNPTTGADYANANGLSLTVPEPSTWAMMVIGFASLGFAGYRTSSRKTATVVA